MKKIIFINSHPIQYYVPMYQYLNNHGINMEAWYGDDSSVQGKEDKGFGQKVSWDIPLLQGYEYRFFKNQAITPTPSGGFFNVVNYNMVRQLFKTPKSILVINGWQFFSYFLCAFFGKLRGHTLWMRCEMPLNQEEKKTSISSKVKRFFLKHIYFKLFSKFLYIGSQNKLFYQKLGVKESKLFFTPYAVDNHRFSEAYKELHPQKNDLRLNLNIPSTAKVILYSGKFIAKKRPMDLLKAFHLANIEDKYLIFLGDGELRNEMEEYTNTHHLKNVLLTGFINQSEIANYYAVADIFVMCSGIGETWGLSVNEAMNFNLPIIASTTIGSSFDLVQVNKNGFVFEEGDIEALKNCIEMALSSVNNIEASGVISKSIIASFSYKEVLQGINKALSA